MHGDMILAILIPIDAISYITYYYALTFGGYTKTTINNRYIMNRKIIILGTLAIAASCYSLFFTPQKSQEQLVIHTIDKFAYPLPLYSTNQNQT
jgi:hypothetical protein